MASKKPQREHIKPEKKRPFYFTMVPESKIELLDEVRKIRGNQTKNQAVTEMIDLYLGKGSNALHS